MELKILLVLSLFLGSSLGQFLNCSYSVENFDGEDRYTCNLNIQNLAGFDNFTVIDGIHLEGRTDADVTAIQRVFGSKSTNIPNIICSQFQNLEVADFQELAISIFDENTLSGCKHLTWLKLYWNEIKEIHERTFASNKNLTFIDLVRNSLTTLPGNVFNGLVNLQSLEMSTNPIVTLPGGIFRPIPNLKRLILGRARINAINTEWFASLPNLEVLSLSGNIFESFPENAFSDLRNLRSLDISENYIGQNLPGGTFRDLANLEALYMSGMYTFHINPSWFEALVNLEILHISSNYIPSIPEGTFDNLTSLLVLNIGKNKLTESTIPGNLFENMPNLLWLTSDFNQIQTLNPQWFQNTSHLTTLNLNFNELTELPTGIFSTLESLNKIELWGNSLRSLRRDSFGFIGNLTSIDLEANKIDAIDERFLTEATSLDYLFLFENLCISERFYEFSSNLETNLPKLGVCIDNFRFFIETTTESGEPYAFFPILQPGIQLRVNTDNEIRIALTPYDYAWNPMMEIVIGGNNNTVSLIIRDQETQVVVVRSPNILRPGQWSGFRITWDNHVVLVAKEEQAHPFLAYTMESVFPIGFYGLRSPLSRAVWSVRPSENGIC